MRRDHWGNYDESHMTNKNHVQALAPLLGPLLPNVQHANCDVEHETISPFANLQMLFSSPVHEHVRAP